jgi:hypothetical protein
VWARARAPALELELELVHARARAADSVVVSRVGRLRQVAFQAADPAAAPPAVVLHAAGSPEAASVAERPGLGAQVDSVVAS